MQNTAKRRCICGHSWQTGSSGLTPSYLQNSEGNRENTRLLADRNLGHQAALSLITWKIRQLVLLRKPVGHENKAWLADKLQQGLCWREEEGSWALQGCQRGAQQWGAAPSAWPLIKAKKLMLREKGKETVALISLAAQMPAKTVWSPS